MNSSKSLCLCLKEENWWLPVTWYWYHQRLSIHWGRVTHICISKLTIIGSDNGLSPGRRQVIIGTHAGIFSNKALGTQCSEILIISHTFSLKKTHLKMLSGKWRPFCLSLNVLRHSKNSNDIALNFVHWGLNKMAKILQKTFSNAISHNACTCVTRTEC